MISARPLPIPGRVAAQRYPATQLGREALYTVGKQDLAQHLDEDVLEQIEQDEEWTWETVANLYKRGHTDEDLVRFDGPEELTSRVQQVLYKKALTQLEHSKDHKHTIVPFPPDSGYILALLEHGDLPAEQEKVLTEKIDQASTDAKLSLVDKLEHHSGQLQKRLLERFDADTWEKLLDETHQLDRYLRQRIMENLYTITAQHYPPRDWQKVPGMLQWDRKSPEVDTQQLEKLAEEFGWDEIPTRASQYPGTVTGETVTEQRRERLMDLIQEEVEDEQTQDNGRSR